MNNASRCQLGFDRAKGGTAALFADPLAESRYLVALIAAEPRPGAVAALNGRILARHRVGRNSLHRPDNARVVRLCLSLHRLPGARDIHGGYATSCRVDRLGHAGIDLRTALGRWNVAALPSTGLVRRRYLMGNRINRRRIFIRRPRAIYAFRHRPPLQKLVSRRFEQFQAGAAAQP